MLLSRDAKRVILVGLLSILTPTAYAVAAPQDNQTQEELKRRADRVVEQLRPEIPAIDQFLKEIRSPDDHDRATSSLGMDATLVNLRFATKVSTPLGAALHIPVQISKRDGGRTSLYFLSPGEKTFAGIYLIGDTIYYRVVQRDSGQGVPAVNGDLYTESILSTDGTVRSTLQGRLLILDWSRGIGLLEAVDDPNSPHDVHRHGMVWVAWSFIDTNPGMETRE